MLHANLLLCFIFVFLAILLMSFLDKKQYWKLLLVTSILFFVIIAGKSILLIVSIAVLTYYFSFIIKRKQSLKWWMTAAILFPLLIKKIVIVEYQFEGLNDPNNSADQLINFVGLSYITFNAIGYLMDIKRKYIEPQTNFFKLLLYLLYFPIIFSGPLTRAKHFFSAIKNIELQRNAVVNGLRLILWGLFKNLVVGSRLLKLLHTITPMELSRPYYLLNGFVFYLFLYCTFSSFINIFQGISMLFNIQIHDNFRNRIYLSASREEFWKGWHITLNQWFRDYFFYEIIRLDKKKKYTNLLLFITFLCIALWHDFTFVFLVWGVLNAIWLITERKYKKYIKLPKQFSFIGIIYHTIIASFLATIFISENIFDVFKTLIDFSEQPIPFELLQTQNTYILLASFIFMDFYERKTKTIRIDKYISKQHNWHRYFLYYTLCLFILCFAINPKIVNYYNLF